MSRGERQALVDRADPHLSIVRQCQLLKVARSTLYYQPAPVSDDDLAVMRRLDERYLLTPFYGARRMVAVLRRDGFVVNRKRVRRLMRVMGIEAIYQKPNTSRRHPEHKVYPYLLGGMAIEEPNQDAMGQAAKQLSSSLLSIAKLTGAPLCRSATTRAKRASPPSFRITQS